MKLTECQSESSARPAGYSPGDIALAGALRDSAAALGPTTRRILLGFAERAAGTDEPSELLRERLRTLLDDLVGLGDLSGERGRPAVAPAPLRLVALGGEEEAARWLVVGGTPTRLLEAMGSVSAPFLRVLRPTAAAVGTIERDIAQGGGACVQLDRWLDSATADPMDRGAADANWLRTRLASFEADTPPTEPPGETDTVSIYLPERADVRQDRRWRRLRATDRGPRLIRIDRTGAARPTFVWGTVGSGTIRERRGLRAGTARRLLFALDASAGRPSAARLVATAGTELALQLDATLPIAERRLVRALASAAPARPGDPWILDTEFAGEVASTLARRLGIRVEGEPA